MDPKSKKYRLFIVACILLMGLSALACFHVVEAASESQETLIQKNMDTSSETPATFSKSTLLLIVCIGLVGILGLRRKRANQANLYLKDKEVAK